MDRAECLFAAWIYTGYDGDMPASASLCQGREEKSGKRVTAAATPEDERGFHEARLRWGEESQRAQGMER